MPLQRNSVPWYTCLDWLCLEDPASRNSLAILEPWDVSGKVKPTKSLLGSGNLDTHGHTLVYPAALMGCSAASSFLVHKPCAQLWGKYFHWWGNRSTRAMIWCFDWSKTCTKAKDRRGQSSKQLRMEADMERGSAATTEMRWLLRTSTKERKKG